MAKIVDGNKISNKIILELIEEVSFLDKKPVLKAIQIGENPQSTLYLKKKELLSKEVGIDYELIVFNKDIPISTLIDKIDELNKDTNVDGIIVQMPLPLFMDSKIIMQKISPMKDVDGFHPLNKGLLDINRSKFIPPTALAVFTILKEYSINPYGKHVVVVGTSEVSGKPIGKLMMNLGATVTFCNKNTKDIKIFTKTADILISAAGVRGIIDDTKIKDKAVVIDVGVTKKDNIIYGDVNVEKITRKASYISPTPGGVGPLTVAFLLKNTIIAYKKNRK